MAQTVLTVKVCFLPGPRSLEQIFCSESLSAAPERRRDPLMRPAVRLMPRNKIPGTPVRGQKQLELFVLINAQCRVGVFILGSASGLDLWFFYSW